MFNNRCVLQQQDVDCKIADALLKKDRITQMVGIRLPRTGRTWSLVYRTMRGVLVCLLTVLLRMKHFILLLHALCPDLVLSLRNVRSCGCLKMIFGTRPYGHHPRLWSFVTFTPSFLTSSTAKRSVCRLRHRSTQGPVLDSAPRMVYLNSRRLIVSHYHRSTASLRIPVCGMRALPPMLTLLTSPHIIGSPNRYSATGSPSRISKSCLQARAELNS